MSDEILSAESIATLEGQSVAWLGAIQYGNLLRSHEALRAERDALVARLALADEALRRIHKIARVYRAALPDRPEQPNPVKTSS